MQIRPGHRNGTTRQEEVVCTGEAWSGDRDRDGGLPKPVLQLRWPGVDTGKEASGGAWGRSQAQVPAAHGAGLA